MTGSLTADEMQADADRFFATLDTNRDGEIDPDGARSTTNGKSRPTSRSTLA